MYETKIVNSSRELTAREKVQMKNLSAAIMISGVAEIENPILWAEVGVHNDKAENPDYKNYVIMTANGDLYRTGSESFFNSFVDIFTEMAEDGEPFTIGTYRVKSKNNSGEILLAKLL